MTIPGVLRVTTAAILAAALMTTAAPGASAERDRSRDARRDVGEVTFVDRGQTVRSDRPRNAAQDIVAVTVRYGGGRVRLALTTRDLPRQGFGVGWFVRTRTATWSVGYVHEDNVRTSFFEREDGEGDERCGRLRARQVNSADRVVLRFPRACIGPRRWIRTGAWVWRLPTEGGDADTVLLDDARLDGGFPGYGPKLGRRISYN